MTYIDSRHKMFTHLDRLAAWQNGDHPAPVTVEWDLSNRCVLGCMDCHFAHTHTRGPWAGKPKMLPMAYDAGGDLADIDLVTRGLDQMSNAGVLGVVWSGGGEPTTHPRWQEIMAWASLLGLKQGMYTLGGLLTPSSATHLAALADWVVVSLDAADAETYSLEKGVPKDRFDVACNGIAMLAAEYETVVGVSFLLHSENWMRAYEMLRLSRELGATYATFRPVIRTLPDRPSVCTDDRRWITDAMTTLEALAAEPDVELVPERFAQYRDWAGRSYSTCHGIKLTAVVTPDGRIWNCPQHRGVGSCVGDLRVESFQEAWARQTGTYDKFKDCRVMCRLHPMNETLDAVFGKYEHGAFL